MYKYKAIKAGVLSDPYKRVREGEVVTLSEPLKSKSRWLVPLEDYTPQPEMVTVPHMQHTAPREPHSHMPPPAAESNQYSEGMKNIKAAEMVQDGKAENYNAAKQELTQVQPNKFVGEAQPVTVAQPVQTQPAPQANAPAPAAPQAQPNVQEQSEGTGNQDVLG